MEPVEIYRVPAALTSIFKGLQREYGRRYDGAALFLNLLAGCNFFYVSDCDTYGEISEERALRYAEEYGLTIKDFYK